jgi:hypothetical protein
MHQLAVLVALAVKGRRGVALKQQHQGHHQMVLLEMVLGDVKDVMPRLADQVLL